MSINGFWSILVLQIRAVPDDFSLSDADDVPRHWGVGGARGVEEGTHHSSVVDGDGGFGALDDCVAGPILDE